jgi:SecD/SecF fusion protein
VQQINVRGRFFVIFLVTLAAVWMYHRWGLKLAQDLRGGTSVRFSIDVDKAKAEGRVDAGETTAKVMEHTIKVITDRVNKVGLSEVEILPLGDNKFEINLPASSEGETESIIQLITTLGDLQFRIEVRPDSQYRQDTGEYKRVRFKVWPESDEAFKTYKEQEVALWRGAADEGRPYRPSRPQFRVVPRQGTAKTSPSDFHVLEEPAKPEERFDGGILGSVGVGRGEQGQPVTSFTVKRDYQGVFKDWTGTNVGLPMAIVLNGEYRSAPVINSALSDHVQVTLGTSDWASARREAESLQTTLQTGSLKIHPEQEAKTKLGARLAGEARNRGIWATITALGLVLLFMLAFYRSMGLVANLALVLNLVLLLGTMAGFQAALSLAGIAGIVLTLGAAVDANILINERIREERQAGRSVHRAIAEGYSRALTTIVDANATTIITAVFLYIYGSGSIRGFAVSLTLGLLISMFTAIFVTRAVFEWQLKRGMLKEIPGLGTPKVPNIAWMALRRVLVPISVVAMLFGFIAFFAVDRYTLYDIDFTGGQKVQMGFSEDTSVGEVKQRLAAGSLPVEVAVTVKDAEGQNVTRRQTVVAGPYDGAEVYAVTSEGHKVEIKVQRASDRTDLTAQEEAQALQLFLRERFKDRLLPPWTSGLPTPIPAEIGEIEAPAAPAAGAPGEIPIGPGAPVPAAGGGAELAATAGGWAFDVAFVDPRGTLTPELLKDLLTNAFPHSRMEAGVRRTLPAATVKRAVVVRAAPAVQPGVRTFKVWLKTTVAAGADGRGGGESIDARDPVELQAYLREWLGGNGFKGALGKLVPAEQADEVELSNAFPSEDLISSSVAERLRDDAVIALMLSFLGIIVYVAVRFHSRSMGIASVLCLFHDVVVTAGVVAVANLAGLVDAKINLTMVAAFLTLVGLSINDTVVIYDRIRENRGKRPTITSAMIDLAVNQCLGRTFKTIATILLVCVALFVFNVGQRNVLEGFAFCLIVGSFVGTYSTVAIAAPLLLYLPWIWERVKALRPDGSLVGYCARHWALGLLLPFALLVWSVWGLIFCLYAFVVGLLLFAPWALRGDVPTETASA